MRKKMTKVKAKMKKVMHEYKEGVLHSGGKKGPVVTNPKQAVAIAYSEANKSKAKSKKDPKPKKKKAIIKKVAKKAKKDYIGKAEELHEESAEDLIVSTKKVAPKKKRIGKNNPPDVNAKYPTLEFVGEVMPTDVENGKKGPDNEEEDKYAKKIAVKEAKSKGMREKERVNYFTASSMKKKKRK